MQGPVSRDIPEQGSAPPEVVVVTTSHPPEGAESLARTLVERRLAACVQVLPGLRSAYRWKGEVCVDPEVRLDIKTCRDRLEDLASALAELHPYDVPEFLLVAVEAGSLRYEAWVAESTRPARAG